MDLIRWRGIDDLRSVQDEMNRLFELRTGGNPQAAPHPRENVSTRVWSPLVDIVEDEHEIVLRADLPGLKQDDIKIELTSDSLTVSGNRPVPDEASREKHVRLERTYGPFQRSFSIGIPLQQDQVTAGYTDGVLEIHLPKAEEIKPKRVEVKVGN